MEYNRLLYSIYNRYGNLLNIVLFQGDVYFYGCVLHTSAYLRGVCPFVGEPILATISKN